MIKNFFRLGFILLFFNIVFVSICALTIFLFGNPFSFSWHPDFFSGVLFGIAFFGSLYLGWLKK